MHILYGKERNDTEKCSTEFKIGVILDMREHRLGYREAARKYELTRTSEASAANIVQRWERIHLEEGAEQGTTPITRLRVAVQ